MYSLRGNLSWQGSNGVSYKVENSVLSGSNPYSISKIGTTFSKNKWEIGLFHFDT